MKLVELTAPRGEAKAQLSEAKIATSLQHPNVVSDKDYSHTGRSSSNPVQGITWRVVVGTQGKAVSSRTTLSTVHKRLACVGLHLCCHYMHNR